MNQFPQQLIIGAVVFNALFQSTFALGADPTATRIPFKLRDHLIVVEGSIGKLNDLSVIIDTGASFTVISPQVARSLRLETSPGEVISWGRQVGVRKGMLPDLTIGGFRFASVPVRVRNLPTTDRCRMDVLIGLDLLRRVPLRIDYSSQELFLGELSPLRFASRFYPNLPIVPVNMRIKDVPVTLILDTGAEGLVLFGKRKQLPFDVSPANSKVRMQHSGGSWVMEKCLVQGASFGESHWRELSVFLLDIPPEAYPQVDGILGPLALGVQRIQLDFKKGILGWE